MHLGLELTPPSSVALANPVVEEETDRGPHKHVV